MKKTAKLNQNLQAIIDLKAQIANDLTPLLFYKYKNRLTEEEKQDLKQSITTLKILAQSLKDIPYQFDN